MTDTPETARSSEDRERIVAELRESATLWTDRHPSGALAHYASLRHAAADWIKADGERLAECERYKQGYYGEAAEGWAKFRAAEAKVAALTRQVGEMREALAPTLDRLDKSDAAWRKAYGETSDAGTIKVPISDMRRFAAALALPETKPEPRRG
jgi:hypothetical protein